MKTSELQGAALDWAVAKCENIDFDFDAGALVIHGSDYYCPSEDWAQAGPIIEREGIAMDALRTCGEIDSWVAATEKNRCSDDEDWMPTEYGGPTLLIAAMRCYVASKMGDEVDVPDEFLEKEIA